MDNKKATRNNNNASRRLFIRRGDVMFLPVHCQRNTIMYETRDDEKEKQREILKS